MTCHYIWFISHNIRSTKTRIETKWSHCNRCFAPRSQYKIHQNKDWNQSNTTKHRHNQPSHNIRSTKTRIETGAYHSQLTKLILSQYKIHQNKDWNCLWSKCWELCKCHNIRSTKTRIETQELTIKYMGE